MTARIAMAQLLVEGGEPERNLERAQKLIEKAATQNAEIVLLPETMDLAWTHPSAFQEAEHIPGKRSNFFSALAKKHNIFICVGLTESENTYRYNTAILINNEGNIIHKHRKINLLEVEFPYYDPGNSLSVIDTKFGKIGINICADNYYDSIHLARSLAHMNAQIILSPSSWTVEHYITEETNPYHEKWIKPLTTIAKQYEIPFISTTSVGYIVGGPYEGKKMIGCSLAVDKQGNYIQGEFNEFASDLKIIDIELGDNKYKGVQYGKRISTFT
ncbi:MAG: carbon-nitrogen hydrolase family protein [Chitinophagales bacterium]|nr:carbon-nitrogen hydrolase family protein [Chitinophagales bacterium]